MGCGKNSQKLPFMRYSVHGALSIPLSFFACCACEAPISAFECKLTTEYTIYTFSQVISQEITPVSLGNSEDLCYSIMPLLDLNSNHLCYIRGSSEVSLCKETCVEADDYQ